MEVLKFNNPVFKPGLNLTVRLGEKWYNNINKFQLRNIEQGVVDYLLKTTNKLPKLLSVPMPVDIQDGDGRSVGKGKVEFVHGCYFLEIPKDVLVFHNDEVCRNLDGLYNALRLAYGEEFHPGSAVSLVFFTVDLDSDNNVSTE